MVSAFLAAGEGEAVGIQQGTAALVVGGGGDDGDVHPAHRVDVVVVDLGEHQLLDEAEGVVAAAVEGRGLQPTEVADARQGHRQQTVEELPHPVAPQGDLDADRHALAQLEAGDGLAGPVDPGLLTGHGRDVLDGTLERLGVSDGLTEADVDDDLLEARNLHPVGDAQLLGQRGHDLVVVALLEPRHLGRGRRGLAHVVGSSSPGCSTRPSPLGGVWRRSRVQRRADRLVIGWLLPPRCGLEGALAPLAAAHLAPAVTLGLVHETDAGGLVARGADGLHVGHVDRGLGLDDAAALTTSTLLLDALVLLDVVDALDEDTVAVGEDLHDTPGPAGVLARDHLDLVVLADAMHHSTSGASETIRMKRLSRSSRATGPKMRVPRGVPSGRMITQALSSNRT